MSLFCSAVARSAELPLLSVHHSNLAKEQIKHILGEFSLINTVYRSGLQTLQQLKNDEEDVAAGKMEDDQSHFEQSASM